MKKIILTIVLATLCLFFRVNAQSQTKTINIKPLNIGDTIPEAVWNMPLQVVNHPEGKKTITLNDYRGKLIILDFWATWCGSCIVAMPRTHKIEEQFRDSVIIISVGYEPKDKILKFSKENDILKSLNIMSVVNDSILKKVFPHRLLPHYVWLFKNEVASITASNDITIPNIQGILKSLNPSIDVKKDILSFNRKIPLLENGAAIIKRKQLYHSLLTKHIPGVSASEGITEDTISKRIYFINRPILGFYDFAMDYMFGNRIVLDVPDSNRFVHDKGLWGDWQKENTFCYELTTPVGTTKEEIQKLILQDLNRYLGLNVYVETRQVDCLAIVASQTRNKSQIENSRKDISLDGIRDLNYQIPAQPLKPIILDESDYNGNLRIKNYKGDISILHNQLKALGLKLIPVKRELSMMVIKQ